MQNTLIIITNAQSLLISASVTYKPPSAVFMLSEAELQRDKTAEWTQLHDQQKSSTSGNIVTSHLPQSQKNREKWAKVRKLSCKWHICGVRAGTWQPHRVDTHFKNFSLYSCSSPAMSTGWWIFASRDEAAVTPERDGGANRPIRMI